LAKLRIKSQWFRAGSEKTPEQTASAMAFTAWRVAQNMLKQMRVAQFDIDIGPQYFAFTREVLVFLTQIIDRMAFSRMDAAARAAFMTALVLRLADILQDNQERLMGPSAPDQSGYVEQFIDLFNELADHYAEFGYTAQGPDFDFVRYLGFRIEQLMQGKDKRYVLDQVMATEVPDAVDYLSRAMDGVLSTEPRTPRRSRPAGISGD